MVSTNISVVIKPFFVGKPRVPGYAPITILLVKFTCGKIIIGGKDVPKTLTKQQVVISVSRSSLVIWVTDFIFFSAMTFFFVPRVVMVLVSSRFQTLEPSAKLGCLDTISSSLSKKQINIVPVKNRGTIYAAAFKFSQISSSLQEIANPIKSSRLYATILEGGCCM